MKLHHRRRRRPLTEAQQHALLEAARLTVEAYTAELHRWGRQAADQYAAAGITFERRQVARNRRTIHALVELGLARLHSIKQGTYETRPQWGRLRRSHHYTTAQYTLTMEGLRLAIRLRSGLARLAA